MVSKRRIALFRRRYIFESYEVKYLKNLKINEFTKLITRESFIFSNRELSTCVIKWHSEVAQYLRRGPNLYALQISPNKAETLII